MPAIASTMVSCLDRPACQARELVRHGRFAAARHADERYVPCRSTYPAYGADKAAIELYPEEFLLSRLATSIEVRSGS